MNTIPIYRTSLPRFRQQPGLRAYSLTGFEEAKPQNEMTQPRRRTRQSIPCQLADVCIHESNAFGFYNRSAPSGGNDSGLTARYRPNIVILVSPFTHLRQGANIFRALTCGVFPIFLNVDDIVYNPGMLPGTLTP